MSPLFPPYRFRRLAWLLFVVLCLVSVMPAQGATGRAAGPVIAVASSVQQAMEEVAGSFTAETGHALRLSFGSSGNFSRQIRMGAPFELFLSADEAFVLDLARDGHTRDEGSVYVVGRLALVVPDASLLSVDGSLDGLERALEAGEIRRFAIANPEHAPYGMRAREALQHRGLWDDMQPVLVFGENVSQAAQFALSGSTQGGLVAYSQAVIPELAARSRYALVPEAWHQPLRQRMALLEDAGPVAESFYQYLQGATARSILSRHGFSTPEE
jgi:molybdate transport system substrate-binding protein